MPALQLLHVDPALVVVDKPAGLLAVPGRGEAGRINLTAQVQAQFPDALVVHRLDMGTSGLMLFARGAEAQRQLGKDFAARRVAKRYVAVVEGLLRQEEGEISAALRLDWPRRPRQLIDPFHGKPSLTRWRCVARDAATSRVELEPVTGRSHQLRVHMMSIGHPIRGDELYGPLPLRAERLLLHAARLSFDHPAHGGRIELRSEPAF